ncbi:tRNA (adenosine(37)-N6)-threonylcarbamoyltransferase complex ATPase subunit type 1 TsaE [Candidatus Similichlamydia epinepheli]|uniref:tRNA (adenosine(37)-N6)-threonylcarbamoyltransferase complex ATPase subunit type 1 TsaE n=1 Tax=Candidatus Similichlamydia epinepheli TaxID=1903953 RepID=UPI0013009CEF|nr:tRNA (adenosine(37)-N6)-threonylcarbamoyltransferase complex ATPase subunit type 1 TsaE [Candidatus Similichlamydia epinepheli]
MTLRTGFFQELESAFSAHLLGPDYAVCSFELDNLDKLASLFINYIPETWELPIWLLLLGDMGSGKTTFVRSIAMQLGVSTVCSPSFTLLQIHQTSRGTLYHFDLFHINRHPERKSSISEFLDSPGLKCIEWPTHELIKMNASPVIILKLSLLSETSRQLHVEARSA